MSDDYKTIKPSLDEKIQQDASFDNIYRTLTIIKDLQQDFENYDNDHNDNSDYNQKDCVVKIIALCIEMYERIIEATITHYLLINIPIQQDLHGVIIRIVADYTVRIMIVLYEKLSHFIFDHEMSLQEKFYYSGGIIAMILVVKFCLEKIPSSVQNGPNTVFFQDKSKDENLYTSGQTHNYK